MKTEEEKIIQSVKVLNPEASIKRARSGKIEVRSSNILGFQYRWKTKMEKVILIRDGIRYETIEEIGVLAGLPVKRMLRILGMPQTTYNKKKREQDLLSGRDSEVILALAELFDFGLEVFNNEKEKFQRWLKKPNVSLAGATPESLFDTITGIQEVKNSLSRLEYGSMA